MLRLNSPNLTERWPPLAAGLAALLLVVVITSGAGELLGFDDGKVWVLPEQKPK